MIIQNAYLGNTQQIGVTLSHSMPSGSLGNGLCIHFFLIFKKDLMNFQVIEECFLKVNQLK